MLIFLHLPLTFNSISAVLYQEHMNSQCFRLLRCTVILTVCGCCRQEADQYVNSPVSSYIQMHQHSSVTWVVTKSLMRVWLCVTAHLGLLVWDLPQPLFCFWLHLTRVFTDQRAHSWTHRPLAMLLALRSLAVTMHLQQGNAGWTLNCCVQKQV